METATYGSDFVSARTCVEKSFIKVILSDTLVYPSGRKATCLEINNMLLKVTSTRMTSYISTTLHYFFVGYGMLLHLRWLPFTLSMERITQMVSYQIIVSTVIFGNVLDIDMGILWNCYIWSHGRMMVDQKMIVINQEGFKNYSFYLPILLPI